MRRTERFDPQGSRYAFDFGLCTPQQGWAQVDTRQDAWYFGTWTNPALRQIVCYCEGDITVECADDDAEYVEALRALQRWNVENGHWKGIDTMLDADIARAFERLGLDDLLHRAGAPAPRSSATRANGADATIEGNGRDARTVARGAAERA